MTLIEGRYRALRRAGRTHAEAVNVARAKSRCSKRNGGASVGRRNTEGRTVKLLRRIHGLLPSQMVGQQSLFIPRRGTGRPRAAPHGDRRVDLRELAVRWPLGAQ
jgi:hypothetical protein